jgi:hypothetical protein
MAALSSLHMFALVGYTLLLVQLLTYIHRRLPSDNEHNIQQNTALAIVRASAPRETPMALNLSASIVIVESEHTHSLFFWSHRPSILAFSCLPNHRPNALFMSIFIVQV